MGKMKKKIQKCWLECWSKRSFATGRVNWCNHFGNQFDCYRNPCMYAPRAIQKYSYNHGSIIYSLPKLRSTQNAY